MGNRCIYLSFFRVTLPCAMQLLTCASTNGGNLKQNDFYSLVFFLKNILVVLIRGCFFVKSRLIWFQIFVRYHRPTGHKENLPWFWCN
jgi:hypothetical protein